MSRLSEFLLALGATFCVVSPAHAQQFCSGILETIPVTVLDEDATAAAIKAMDQNDSQLIEDARVYSTDRTANTKVVRFPGFAYETDGTKIPIYLDVPFKETKDDDWYRWLPVGTASFRAASMTGKALKPISLKFQSYERLGRLGKIPGRKARFSGVVVDSAGKRMTLTADVAMMFSNRENVGKSVLDQSNWASVSISPRKGQSPIPEGGMNRNGRRG